jgi:hypothetical protein
MVYTHDLTAADAARNLMKITKPPPQVGLCSDAVNLRIHRHTGHPKKNFSVALNSKKEIGVLYLITK